MARFSDRHIISVKTMQHKKKISHDHATVCSQREARGWKQTKLTGFFMNCQEFCQVDRSGRVVATDGMVVERIPKLGWNGYYDKSQHRKSTLEKKILPPLLQGFELGNIRS